MIDKKLAIVTGGSRGIGRGIAKELAIKGLRVIIVYRSSDSKAEEFCSYMNEQGAEAYSYKCDVSDYSAVEEMVEKIIDKYGKIDYLVNNAGISHMGMLIDMEEEQWDSIVDINLKSMFNLCKFVGKHMMWNKCGSIVNISSIWGDVGASCEVAYSATKGGINSFTRALAKELAPSGVRVNGVSPGVIETEMNSWMSDSDREELADEIPMGRFGEVHEIGKVVSFLCSDDSSYVNGQIIRVDGAMI